jgi:hypothetical protein
MTPIKLTAVRAEIGASSYVSVLAARDLYHAIDADEARIAKLIEERDRELRGDQIIIESLRTGCEELRSIRVQQIARAESAEARVLELVEVLRDSRMGHFYGCAFMGCPSSECDCKCDCGADEHNAKINAVLNGAK